MGRIFICEDTGLAELLAPAAAALSAEGHDVVRGPINAVGKVEHYTEAERAEWIDGAMYRAPIDRRTGPSA